LGWGYSYKLGEYAPLQNLSSLFFVPPCLCLQPLTFLFFFSESWHGVWSMMEECICRETREISVCIVKRNYLVTSMISWNIWIEPLAKSYPMSRFHNVATSKIRHKRNHKIYIDRTITRYCAHVCADGDTLETWTLNARSCSELWCTYNHIEKRDIIVPVPFNYSYSSFFVRTMEDALKLIRSDSSPWRWIFVTWGRSNIF